MKLFQIKTLYLHYLAHAWQYNKCSKIAVEWRGLHVPEKEFDFDFYLRENRQFFKKCKSMEQHSDPNFYFFARAQL